MKKSVTLYNVLFPMFFLVILPRVWTVVLPLNLAIDALVIYLTLRSMEKKALFGAMWKKEVWLCWLLGFLADIAGAGMLIGLCSIPGAAGGGWSAITNAISNNPFRNTTALGLVFLCILLTGALIYLLNLWVTFKKTDLPLKDKRTLCLSLAIFTAPYAYLIPSTWFYTLIS